MTGLSGSTYVETTKASVSDVVARPGTALDTVVRRTMEARIGTDFSAVRVHADQTAAASAQQLDTRAYAVGQHVVFGSGHYQPNTSKGQSLLAHELTHTVQQRGRTGFSDVHTLLGRSHPAEREAAAAAHVDTGPPAITQTTGAGVSREEGTAEIVDTVTNYQSTATQYSARVRREQYRTHAEADQARAGGTPPNMDTGHANIVLDASVPEIRVPVNIVARAANESDYGTDNLPDKRNKGSVSPAQISSTVAHFKSTIDSQLNGWYNLRVPPCKGVPFAGRTLPVRVVITVGGAGTPDYTVCVSPHEGRSFVSPSGQLVVLFANGANEGTLAHEGTHMALGLPDEYAEDDADLKKKFPLQKGEERVRNDFPISGSHFDWGRWARMHERHFSFVPVFVQDVLTRLGHPECKPTLKEAGRPTQIIVRPSFEVGGSNLAPGGILVGGGLDLGWELNRKRTWLAFVGAHGHYVMGDYKSNNAFLLGARLGFERRWNPGGVSPGLGLFGEGGAAGESASTKTPPRSIAPYGAVGARLDIGTWGSGAFLHAGVEALTGVRLDREHLRFAQLGFHAAVDF